jgi:hypothetical protein
MYIPSSEFIVLKAQHRTIQTDHMMLIIILSVSEPSPFFHFHPF